MLVTKKCTNGKHSTDQVILKNFTHTQFDIYKRNACPSQWSCIALGIVLLVGDGLFQKKCSLLLSQTSSAESSCVSIFDTTIAF